MEAALAAARQHMEKALPFFIVAKHRGTLESFVAKLGDEYPKDMQQWKEWNQHLRAQKINVGDRVFVPTELRLTPEQQRAPTPAVALAQALHDEYAAHQLKKVPAAGGESMRFQVVSDLHLDSLCGKDVEIPCLSDALVLLGDICDPFSVQYARFIATQARRFRNVLVVLGNHEYYHNRQDPLEQASRVCSQHPNVHLLEKGTVVLGNVRFLGTTLWSNADPKVEEWISDYRCIPDWTHAKSQEEHARCLAWLKQELQASDQPTVVLTHHAPLLGITSSPKHAHSPANSAFATDLSDMMEAPIVMWLHGHTHWCHCTTVKSGVLVASNAAGFRGEDVGHFDPARVFVV